MEEGNWEKGKAENGKTWRIIDADLLLPQDNRHLQHQSMTNKIAIWLGLFLAVLTELALDLSALLTNGFGASGPNGAWGIFVFFLHIPGLLLMKSFSVFADSYLVFIVPNAICYWLLYWLFLRRWIPR